MKNHIESMSSIEKNMEAGDIYMYTVYTCFVSRILIISAIRRGFCQSQPSGLGPCCSYLMVNGVPISRI